ncbi:hypothetical protein ACVBEF_00395 [Glaciimonas sp. GG7]
MTLFDKTPRGREEIATRSNVLTARLRTLLLLVDGKTDSPSLLQKVAGLGLAQEHLEALLEAGMIAPHAIQLAPAPAVDASAAVSPPAANTTVPTQTTVPIGASQFEAVYGFYNETIKSALGLRGYGLQLKVERASSIDEFKELRQLYLEAVLKAKGKEVTRSLRDRLDSLLYPGQSGPNSILLD